MITQNHVCQCCGASVQDGECFCEESCALLFFGFDQNAARDGMYGEPITANQWKKEWDRLEGA